MLEIARGKTTRLNYRELSRQARRALQRRNVELAERAEATARRLVPVDTGALKATIRVVRSRGWAVLVIGGGDVDYAPYVEWGTRFQAAQPFLTPAIEDVKRYAASHRLTVYRG